MMGYKLDSIEDAIKDFAEGKFLIVVDDEDRENEGDFIVAAEKITPEKVNFMLKNARGLLCAPITLERCKELELPYMVQENTSMLGTPFTVTIDKLEGCSTGVSAEDRAATINALCDPKSTPQTFGRPGHINPLYAQEKGVLRRAGHTEAGVDLARLAGLYPAAALMEIMNEDGTMARLPQLMEISKKFGIKIITIKDLIAYRLEQESLIERGEEVHLPTEYGDFNLIPFRQKSNGLEHIAIIKGEWSKEEPVLVRVHSSCMTGDIFGSKRCDCGEQLHKAMQKIDKEGKGVIVYLNQEGRGIGLM
ncbi:MAG: 3,4-dihydroxy-2-butanone-4-phosphate synthase, partial [Paludibacteraceae bacterium]|nr:3,4-dihydroxy-2-butanone-4-phosphate synthase [Paludibacteraceae bacterium]